MATASRVRIGVSGWRYPGWRGKFYPRGLAQARELAYASRQFDTLELNGSFYSLQRPASFAQWEAATPADFVFAVKGSRYITHMRRLRQVEVPLANFFAQGLLRLGPKLGPILWQFPPHQAFDAGRFDAFFSLLPRTQAAAAALARRHDRRLAGRSWLRIARDAVLRHAVEIRHESFVGEEFLALLRRHRLALVVADSVDWPRLTSATADFVYCRLHGSQQLYASGYGPKALDRWAQWIAAWARGDQVERGQVVAATRPRPRDVYVYFDNDAKVRAPADARELRRRLLAPSAAPPGPGRASPRARRATALPRR